MKFHLAWADVLSQNALLKFVVFALTLSTIAFGLTTLKLSLQPPLLIERGCVSQVVHPASATEHTEEEIGAFLRAALSQRFDTEAIADTSLVSDLEKLNRKREQEELKGRGMRQRVLVNAESVQIQGASVRLNVDRLISTATLRTDLLFSVVLALASTDRTPSNPYGLTLQSVLVPEAGPNSIGAAGDLATVRTKEGTPNEKRR